MVTREAHLPAADVQVVLVITDQPIEGRMKEEKKLLLAFQLMRKMGTPDK